MGIEEGSVDVYTARRWDTGWGLDNQALVSLVGRIDAVEKKWSRNQGSAGLPKARGEEEVHRVDLGVQRV